MKASPEIGAILKCLVCARDKPWGIFSNNTGEAVCIECRDARHRIMTAERKYDEALAREAALREGCMAGNFCLVCRWARGTHWDKCPLAQPSPATGKVLVDAARLEALERLEAASNALRVQFGDNREQLRSTGEQFIAMWGHLWVEYDDALDALRAGEEGAK